MAGDRGPSSVEEPRWPLVLGWVCIFYAIYALLDLLQFGSQYLVMALESSSPSGWSPPVWLLVLWLLREATVIGALAGGILIHKRMRSAHFIICAYAAAALVLNLILAIGAAVTYGAAIGPYGIAASSLDMASSVALPVFVLIWFTRPTVRQEIAGWGRRRDSRRPADGPRWPWVVAAASIATAYVDVFAAARSLAGLLQYVSWVLQSSGGGLTGALGQISMQSYAPVNALPLAPLLVGGAALLLKRRRATIWPHLIWAGMTLLLALAYVEFAYRAVVSILSGLHPLLRFDGVDALWGMGRLAIYPVFLLIWFLRPGIRRELRGWAARRAP